MNFVELANDTFEVRSSTKNKTPAKKKLQTMVESKDTYVLKSSVNCKPKFDHIEPSSFAASQPY
jgi:hypothetical protein